MENKATELNNEVAIRSAPTLLRSRITNTPSATYLSAATHPAVRLNNKDLGTRFRNFLCHLPTKIDPNLQFSEDEEDEEEEEDKSNDLKALQNIEPVTPEPPNFPTPSSKNNSGCKIPTILSGKKMSSNMSPPSVFSRPSPRKPLSECKQVKSNTPRFDVPQSDYKKKNPTNARSALNLMSQPEFKVPLERPIPSVPKKPQTNDVFVINGKSYSVLSMIGSGGSCKVYSAYTMEKSLVAIKCVDLRNADTSIRDGYRKEIEYLRKLQGSDRVIRMYDYEYRNDELFLVLERGDIDLAKYISQEAKLRHLSSLMVKFYWQQMLEAVAEIHKFGIVHSDLKPANFLLVAGKLKLIDFGIATSVPEDHTSIIRDTQVGTLNYMSPEAITQHSGPTGPQKACFKVGVKSDVWSLGCILYNLVYGLTPFHGIKHLVQKINAITNPNHPIPFNPLPDPHLVDVLKLCLQRNPKERASVEQLLNHPYLTSDVKVKEKTSTSSNDLQNVMQQMQDLTPRRISILTRVVKELSEKQN